MATGIDRSLATIVTLEDLLDHLGGIAPARVRFRPALGSATEVDLIDANDRGPSLCELVDGTLVEKGMGYEESALDLVVAFHLRAFVIPRNLGLISGADGMLRMFPGNVRLPDVAYASWDKIPGRRMPSGAIASFAPDLAVEVLSRSNTRAEMARKRRNDFEAGVLLVWEIDPRARTVTVYQAADEGIALDATATLDGGEVLPGFALPLADLFGELDRQGG